ncbi:exported hypothetical protein [Cupriavidus taiwanensis]|nr:exported hypothetical protein [Cupriavidus taiwanensis]SPA18810.1 exported hypothetical protein [Cupriavidus taiwanensis]
MPSALSRPARRPYRKLLRVTMAKSGPGLITASTVTAATARVSARGGMLRQDMLCFLSDPRSWGSKRTQFCVPQSAATTDIYSRDSVRKTDRCTGWDGSDSSRPRRATRALPVRRRSCT